MLGGIGLVLLAAATAGWCVLYAEMAYDFIFPFGPYDLTGTNPVILLSMFLPYLGTALQFVASMLMVLVGYRLASGRPLRRAPYLMAWLLAAEMTTIGANPLVYLMAWLLPLGISVGGPRSLGVALNWIAPLIAGVLAAAALVVYHRNTLRTRAGAGILAILALLVYWWGSPFSPPVASDTLGIIRSTTSLAQTVSRLSLNYADVFRWMSWGFDLILLSLGLAIALGTLWSSKPNIGGRRPRIVMASECVAAFLFGLGFVVVGFVAANSLNILLGGISSVSPILVSGLESMEAETLNGMILYAISGIGGILIVVASLIGMPYAFRSARKEGPPTASPAVQQPQLVSSEPLL